MIGLPEAVLVFGGSLVAILVALSLLFRGRADIKRSDLVVREKIAAAMTHVYYVANAVGRDQNKPSNRPVVKIRATETVKTDQSSTNN